MPDRVDRGFRSFSRRVEVALHLHEREVGEDRLQDRLAPQAGGRDLRAGGELVDRRRVAADEEVPRVGPLRHRAEDQPFRELRRQVLERVDRDGDLFREQGPFNFLHEQALAGPAELRGGRDPVPGGLDGDDHEVHGRMELLEPLKDLIGLGDGEGAAAGADLDG